MITDKVFSGSLFFGEISNETQKQIAFNFQLSHGKNFFVGVYRFDSGSESSPEHIEFFNNDMNRCFAKIEKKKKKSLVRRFHRYMKDHKPDVWCMISPALAVSVATHQEILPFSLPQEMSDDREADLKIIFENINRKYFNGEINVDIEWGKNVPARDRVSIVLGSYCEEKDCIRISPYLKRDFVPHFFVESVIYHEMLHVIHGHRRVRGRNQIHTPEFKEEEKKFEHFQLSKDWLKENIIRLLSE